MTDQHPITPPPETEAHKDNTLLERCTVVYAEAFEAAITSQAVAPQSRRSGVAAVLNHLADEIEERGEKGLDLDPGETADWLRAEASHALLATKPPHPQIND